MGTMMTPKQVGDLLRLSETTVYKLIRDKILPGFKIGNSWRFDSDEIHSMIRSAKKKA